MMQLYQYILANDQATTIPGDPFFPRRRHQAIAQKVFTRSIPSLLGGAQRQRIFEHPVCHERMPYQAGVEHRPPPLASPTSAIPPSSVKRTTGRPSTTPSSGRPPHGRVLHTQKARLERHPRKPACHRRHFSGTKSADPRQRAPRPANSENATSVGTIDPALEPDQGAVHVTDESNSMPPFSSTSTPRLGRHFSLPGLPRPSCRVEQSS